MPAIARRDARAAHGARLGTGIGASTRTSLDDVACAHDAAHARLSVAISPTDSAPPRSTPPRMERGAEQAR
jgi:hypothetical protein